MTLAAALRLARSGRPVFPCSHQKSPLVPRGLYAATTDPDTIGGWWKRWPDALPAVPAGTPTRSLLLDVDTHGGINGNDSLYDLQERFGNLPDTYEVLTPSGGRHLWFRIPEEVRIRNSAGELGIGLDVRGDGGYGIAEGALNGGAYEMEASSLPWEERAMAPDWLLDLCRDDRPADTDWTGGGASGPAVREGERNWEEFRLACSMRGRGCSTDTVLAALRADNDSRCVPPLPDRELVLIANGVGRYAPGATETQVRGGSERSISPFLFADDLSVITPTEYLVHGWIETGTVNVLFAPKDTLKSFVSIDLGLSCSACIPWHGMTTTPAALVYVAGEGNRGYRKRIKAWCIRHKVDMLSLPIAVSDRPMQVLDTPQLLEWRNHIAEVRERFGGLHLFVVIDTMSTNMGPGDENSSSDMGRFMAAIRIHIVTLGCCTCC